jgi:2-iminobutanoate/2-iminopropanoate deaminase
MLNSYVSTERAPKAIGPYSQAVRVPVGNHHFIYTSGQIALDPATGELVAGDVAAQSRQVLDNLAAVLAAADASFSHVVKTTIFLVNMDDFSAVNAVYGERFKVNPPARSTVQAAKLPRGALVEIEAIAVV